MNSIELRNALNTVIQLGNETSSNGGGITNVCSLFSRYYRLKLSENWKIVVSNYLIFNSNFPIASKVLPFMFWIYREGGIRVLLSYCNGSRGGNILSHHSSIVPVQRAPSDIRILALRGLGAICCVAECIRQFESVCRYTNLATILFLFERSLFNVDVYITICRFDLVRWITSHRWSLVREILNSRRPCRSCCRLSSDYFSLDLRQS